MFNTVVPGIGGVGAMVFLYFALILVWRLFKGKISECSVITLGRRGYINNCQVLAW